ncbi:hypothetical protein CSA17_00500 [bacterium DOLJORAL78_65_58]|nr:MAG: hypothetical protein CSB20_09470 [bacterium DOLZORAL124_64_63]PIE76763.1 MAG: hypothetical protein CSA17_00500 [bacterium DOLJORAL78_65_58]
MPTVWTGTLKKMGVEAAAPVRYRLRDGWHDAAERVADYPLNPHLGQPLELRFGGQINCIVCGRKVKKTFSQGYCYPCTMTRAAADICIVKPELCHHGDAENPCREEDFAQSVCFRPHYLYCSLTSGVKVGITREANIPSRWIDQGAVAAVPVAVLPSRRDVGLVEKRLSDEGFADKTHWTRMLKGETSDTNLQEVVERVVARLRAWGVEGVLPASERREQQFAYPVLEWPTKVKSHNLDRNPVAGGVLQGIKGQYLIFDTGVINLRKYAGYRVEVVSQTL